MARASRKKRLQISSAVGKPPTWTPSQEDWSNIEQAYDVALNDHMCSEITAIVDRYFNNEPFGRNAKFVDDAVAFLRSLDAAAVRFIGTEPEKGGGEVMLCAQLVLDEHLLAAGLPLHHDVVEMLRGYALATASAVATLKEDDQPSLHEKSAWRAMIKELWSFASDNGLPVALDGNRDAKHSAFVRFVLALQHTFGDVPAWHQDKPDTLLAECKKVATQVRKFKTSQKQTS